MISLGKEGGEAVVAVQDNGIGIAPQALEQVFDMFSQSGGSEGLGIGLSLVRTLVQMHGGSVQACSEGLGRGARFSVRLPLVEGIAAAAEAVPRPPTARTRGQRGWGQEADRQHTRDAGMDHHLIKPVSFDVLRGVLDALASS